MYFNISIRCLILYCCLTLATVHSQDLFDMFDGIKDQVVKNVDKASAKVKQEAQKYARKIADGETCPATYTNEYRTVLISYRQLVRDWLEKFPSENGGEYRFLLTLPPSDIKRLKKFASSASWEQKDDLSEVHATSDLLKRSVHKIEENIPDFNQLSWSGWIRSFDVTEIFKYVLALLMIVAFSIVSIRIHLRRGRWLSTLMIAAFIASVIQNWYKLYQDAQAKIDEVLMKKIPKHCQGQTMGVFDMIKAKLGRFVELPSNECLEYHKALRASPHAQVTPIQAISVTFAQLFGTPLGMIGENLSEFFAGTMRHVPIVMWPVMILLILFIVVILILMCSRYEIHLPFMMGSIRPAPLPPPAPVAVEQIDHQANAIAANQIQQLQNTVQRLQLELQEKTLQLEHNPSTTARASRSSSIGRRNPERERSSSTQRPNASAQAENELRQRTTTADIGFRKDLIE